MIIQRAIILGVLLFCAGCSRSSNLGERNIERLRAAPPANLRVVELTINRAKLKTALEDTALVHRLRVVETFASSVEVQAAMPRYRVFGVESGSVYELLGLQNADLLVAANDRVLANLEVFKQYVQLLPAAEEAKIEIERGKEPIAMNYKFVD